MVTRLHLPHAIVVSLHVRKSNVVILTPETAVTVGVWAVAYSCRYDFPSRTKPWMLPGPHDRGLTTTRTLLSCSLYWEQKGSKCLMVLRVKPTPTRFPTNSLYTPMDNIPLHSISSVCHPGASGLLLQARGALSMTALKSRSADAHRMTILT